MRRIFFVAVTLLSFCLPATAQRLPRTVMPYHYDLDIAIDFPRDSFKGDETIHLTVHQSSREIVLHARDLTLEAITLTAGSREQRGEVSKGTAEDQIRILFPEAVEPGPATLSIRYRGMLNRNLEGLYVGEMDGRKYAATQLEATAARLMFPSFDEPEFKATFSLSADVEERDTVISNGRVLAEEKLSGGRKKVQFSTTPRMSTYLVALVVGDFGCLESTADGIPIRICANKRKVALGDFALGVTKDLITFFHKYYGIRYPFEKLDQIGIPDFEAGAMENTGAIIYREARLLVDERRVPVETKRSVANIIAHEIAHQWFGDLVTMRWWDDLWLNEGFASWMSSKAVGAWRPSWRINLNEVLAYRSPMNTDLLSSTRPIYQPVEKAVEIESSFDSIAYGKAAAMLRMVEAYMGPEAFRSGVNRYLASRSYGNATSADFAAALAAETNLDVDRVIDTYIRQPGVPLVKVEMRCDGGRGELVATQRRLQLEKGDKPAAGRWAIPVCLTDGGCRLLEGETETIPLAGCGAVPHVNANGRGYFVTQYPDGVALALARSKLTPEQRIVLLRDQWTLARAGLQPIATYFDVVEASKDSRDTAVITELIENLSTIEAQLITSSNRPRFEAWVRDLLGPVLRDLEKQKDEIAEEVRDEVIYALGRFGRDRRILEAARREAKVKLARPEENPVTSTTLGLAAIGGGAALYDQLLKAQQTAKQPDEASRYLVNLAKFDDPALVRRTIDLALSPSVRNQDAMRLLAAILSDTDSRDVAWAIIKQRWADISRKVPPSTLGRIASATGSFCTAEGRDDVSRFFKEHPLPVNRSLRQAQERVANCMAFGERQGANAAQWLRERGN